MSDLSLKAILNSKTKIATAISIIFHLVGLAGFSMGFREVTLQTTPIHLLLMFALILYTHEKINKKFILFFLICVVVGIGVEIYGTKTGLLFGEYAYGSSFGPGIFDVPFLIGINWFIIIYCCACTVNIVFQKLYKKVEHIATFKKNNLHKFSMIVDAAFLAVITDYFLEPAATKLGYWTWLGNGEIPFYNYVCWFVVSVVLLAFMSLLVKNQSNKFALNLLLVQIMFFMIVSNFL